MPNHVINLINLKGDKNKITEMLEAIKADEFGIGSVDFEKVIPMPESLRIESGSKTDKGLRAYKDFIEVLTFDGANADMDLLNIPEEKENRFLSMRTDIKRDEWELGRQAFRNEKMYGEPTWYDWAIKNWGTKWNSYGYDYHDRSDVAENPTLGFNTAWSAPHPIIRKLAEMYPEVSFEHVWADEDIGQNCGRSTYGNGQCTGVFYPEGDAATVFALKAWGELDDAEPQETETMGEQKL